MSVLNVAQKLDLQAHVHNADELIRVAAAVARKIDRAHKEIEQRKGPLLDTQEVSEYAKAKYDYE